MSHVTCHVSLVTCGGACWRRVCYQQGLPRLVYLFVTWKYDAFSKVTLNYISLAMPCCLLFIPICPHAVVPSGVTLHMQVFSEKCELPCELSQSNLLLSEPDQSALCRDREKCIFRAFNQSEKSAFYGAFIVQYSPLPLKFYVSPRV